MEDRRLGMDGGLRMESQETLGLLLSDDMIFSSRVTGTARALGLKIVVAKSPEDLITQAREHSPVCVILDLSQTGEKINELIGNLREDKTSKPRLVAYGSHVDAATLRAAREAGCDLVFPRSRFVEELPRQLAEWLLPSGSSPADQARLE
jgi:ActR/RegA family two-component response regulator